MKIRLAKDLFKDGLILTPDPDDADTIIVTWDAVPEFQGDGEEYSVYQFGIWCWKKFAVVQWIPDCAAGGISSGPHPAICSAFFKSREQARDAMSKGEFEL